MNAVRWKTATFAGHQLLPIVGPAVSGAPGLSAFCRGLEDLGYDTLWVVRRTAGQGVFAWDLLDRLRLGEIQVAGLPATGAQSVIDAVAEYEAQGTIEAICAKDADKLECLIQAVEYCDVGARRIQDWIDSSRAALKTDFAMRVADAAITTSTLAWRE